MGFANAHWTLEYLRARVLYIFSLVASLLVASEQKNPFTSGRCVLRHMQCRVAGEVLAALVVPVPLSFLAALSPHA